MVSLTNSLTVVVVIAVVTDIIVSYRMGVEDAGFCRDLTTGLAPEESLFGIAARL